MKKLFILLSILPALSFCDYKMYDTKEGVFVIDEKNGNIFKYTNYNDDVYGEDSDFTRIYYVKYKDDEGIKGKFQPNGEYILITESKSKKIDINPKLIGKVGKQR